MPKSTLQPTTVFTFAQRTDLVLSSYTADILARVALRAEAWREKFKNEEFRKTFVDCSFVITLCAAAGVLLAFLTAWIA